MLRQSSSVPLNRHALYTAASIMLEGMYDTASALETPCICLVSVALPASAFLGMGGQTPARLAPHACFREGQESNGIDLPGCSTCRYQPGMRPPRPSRDFGKYWELHCEVEWRKIFRIFSYGEHPFALISYHLVVVRLLSYSKEYCSSSAYRLTCR
jgi:hypothetical protein